LSIFLIKSMIDYRSEISLWIATAPTLLLRAEVDPGFGTSR
jgi:hypothetical protein